MGKNFSPLIELNQFSKHFLLLSQCFIAYYLFNYKLDENMNDYGKKTRKILCIIHFTLSTSTPSHTEDFCEEMFPMNMESIDSYSRPK